MILAVVTILSICITNCIAANFCEFLTNILNSIIAATIFYWIVDYMPFVKKKKIMRILIGSKLFELNEHIRLCKEIPTSRFNIKSTTYKDCKEYAEEFYKINLEEKSIFSSSQTWKEYLESHKKCIADIISTLFDLHAYLSDKELTANYNATVSYYNILSDGGNADNNNSGGDDWDSIINK